MASLTTVYMISVLLSSAAGMGAAFVGNKIYPIKGGAEVPPPTPAEVKKATAEAADKAARLAAADSYQIAKAQEIESSSKEKTPIPLEPKLEVEDVPEPVKEETKQEPVKEEPKQEPEPVKEETKAEPEPVKEEPEPVKEEPEADKLTKAIMDGFGMDAEFAKNVVAFIKTPVTSWEEIATTQSELRQKFMKTLTHPNLNKCPEALKNICKIVSVKYSNMKDFIEKKGYTPFGDETADALNVLSSSSST